jgi:GDP-L-fucose synthase
MANADSDALYAGKKILVTGATGLYGRNLIPRLLAKGATVRAVARRVPATGFGPDVEFVAGDLKEPSFARQVVAGCDGLFHMAGTRGSIGIQIKRAAEMLHDNTLSCFNALNAAREAGVARVVYVSTVSVYPPGERYVEDQAWSANPHPGNEFVAWSKRMAEKLIEAFEVQYGAKNFAIVRPVNTFGPWDDFNAQTALVVPALIGRALGGESPLSVWGDGTAVRDFLYVEDAVDGLLASYERGLGKGPINLGSGRGYSVAEVVAAILRHGAPGTSVRWDVDKPAGEARKVADTARAETILGFTPKIGLEEGIARTIAWYRARD